MCDATFTPKFEAYLEKHGVHPPGYVPSRRNRDDIEGRRVRRRPSLSPPAFTNAAFDRFRWCNMNASGEKAVIATIMHRITGDTFDFKSAMDAP